MRRALALLLCSAAVSAAAGCGLGEGPERSGGAELRVTRDFGHERLATVRAERIPEGTTVMRLLRSKRRVTTRFGGGFVQSIDGLAGSSREGTDWFYWVNGIEASRGAAEFDLFPGDVVQWDHRDWGATMRIPAIVGAFPEPFLHGFEGKRLPTRVECPDPAGAACREVKRRLAQEGIAANGAAFGSSAGAEVLRVIVAPWGRARELSSIRALEEGPEQSGVFARFGDEGARLELLDEEGETARVAGAGSGLVAAIAFAEAKSVWVVTGVDDAGVLAAARAIGPDLLEDAFAVAATAAGPVRLPVIG